jgi:protein involved in polysaccharide export with SLBB domain
MHMRWGKQGKQIRLGAFFGLALLLTGCATTPGRPFSLFPEGNPLHKTTVRLRQANPLPLPLPRELDRRLLPTYDVEPGDVLLVQPADLDSPVRLPGDQPVLPDGTINLGRYGRIVVAGKTVDDIEALVKAAVEAQTKNAGPINVRIVGRQSKVFYVLGEVNAPGSFPLQGRECVLDAILAAGGLTDRASRRRITLSRPTLPPSCRVVLPICYTEIVQLGDTSTNYQIAPGDRIFVPSRSLKEELLPSSCHKDCPPCGGPQEACVMDATTIGCDPTGPCSAWLGKPQPAPVVEPTSTPPIEVEPRKLPE